LVSFEIFPTIWWPHSGRLSTKRWTPPFCIHVVDAADPAFRSHIQVTKEVLEDIGAGKLPSLAILNKIDLVDSSRKALLEKEFPEAIAMSLIASTGGVGLLPAYAQNFLLSSVTSRPLKGDTPTVELVLGYKKSNQSPILKLLLSRLDELVARVSKKAQ